MRLVDEGGVRRVVWSASDLKAAAECEFAWLRALDAKLGRADAVEDPYDATLERAGLLGGVHEQRTLEEYRQRFGDRVAEIPAAASSDPVALADSVAVTKAALADAANEVVYQAAFARGDFVGFADFLVRDDERRWIVQDTKLARRARVTALMQLAAYVEQLDASGVARSDRVELLLGDGSVSVHRVDDLVPVFRLRRARLAALIADREISLGSAGSAIAWGDQRGELAVVACGRCATCESEVVAARDLLLVAGLRPSQRERLRAAGIESIDDLAVATAAPARMNPETFSSLRTQARLQLTSPAGVPDAAPVGSSDVLSSAPAVPKFEVVFPQVLGALPRPDRGDMFFDFEGDPLYTEGPATQWGIDYLFGWVDVDEQYTALWAHRFAEERAAFERFLDIVALRRAAHPGMHIYHYAPYEPTHLLTMAARYGVREAEVDRLLRDGVFVDLYPIVRRALRIGSRSYSIKKLEPLYMGSEVRTSDVQRGDDSIVRYVEARALIDEGDVASAEAIFADLADYNRYDCVSTLRLRDWLVDRARDAGMRPATEPDPVIVDDAPSPRSAALLRLADDDSTTAGGDSGSEAGDPAAADDAEMLRLAAAAIDFYPRERKTFWATHFLRLREPVGVWADARDVIVVDAVRSRVIEDWHRPEGARSDRRLVELRGEVAPGSRLKERGRPFVVYERPAPFPVDAGPRSLHAARSAEVVEVLDDGVIVSETPVDGMTWSALPVAVTPEGPPPAGSQQGAIDEWADGLLAVAPSFPADPATDLLRRRPPRTRSGSLTRGTGDDVSDIAATLIDLDRSYLAVQGPPGTGKTYVGSHVIARLVAERGYRVGVVAQSHAVVENMLARVVEAGVPKAAVAKAPKEPATGDEPYTVIQKNGVQPFVEAQRGGFVVGGTAWDFAHAGRVPRGSLDLLVIDEAGQFSLASTIAVAVAAPRLLLLGDPQQLPQVSQGTHPAPVDASALGWLMDGVEVIAEDRGFFLARTRRMHPAVAESVSELSYARRLASHPVAAARELDGVVPGIHPVPVSHRGNATESPEEAQETVALVRGLLGRAWTSADDHGRGIERSAPRPLTAADIIVVTPYNAQQTAIENALADAGLSSVRVGTVDRFQGQEAVVAIVSLAASSGRDAPRGLEFLLLQNRLNVAVSRAQYAAYVLYSPGLLDDLPRTPEGVARLSAFARLVGAASARVDSPPRADLEPSTRGAV